MSRLWAPRAPLRAPTFRLLRDQVRGYSGLSWTEESMPIFERKLTERLEALGLADFEEYHRFLRFHPRGPTELEEAVDLLTTNETYLFRQEYQLRAFQREVLPALAEQRRSTRRLTIWSAGCSTGEEVYTLAILLQQSGLFDDWHVRILGSDISRRSLATARRGVYREASFRAAPPEIRRRYFQQVEDGWRVKDELRRTCQFGHLNLTDTARVAVVGKVDAVFCRNVIIYFDPPSRRRVIDNLYDRLLPGGYLMLGHSESLINLTTAFELVHLSEDLVYRRPAVPVEWGPSSR